MIHYIIVDEVQGKPISRSMQKKLRLWYKPLQWRRLIKSTAFYHYLQKRGARPRGGFVK